MSNPRASPDLKKIKIVPNSNLIKIEYNSKFYYGTSRRKAWVEERSNSHDLRSCPHWFMGSNPILCNNYKI